MPTFLHTADIHLDSAFSARFDARSAAQRRHELLRAVSEMADIAKKLDIWLIAGDLFDGNNVSAETVAFLKKKFAEMPDTKIFIAAGNHDAFTSSSVYAREDFGENVHIFSAAGECVELAEINTRVFGVSFDKPNCDTLPIPHIEKKDGVFDILLLHADLTAGGESSYNPIDKGFIEGCGADYLALGHIHKRTEPQRCGTTVYAYPGPPEGRGFDECGDMGCYIGRAENGDVDIEYKSVCRRRMLIAEVDLSGIEDNISAVTAAKNAMQQLGGADDIYRLILKGRVLNGAVNPDILREELLREVHYLEIRDETEPDYSFDELALQSDLCGEFVRYMQKKIAAAADEERLALTRALKLGTDALLGGDER